MKTKRDVLAYLIRTSLRRVWKTWWQTPIVGWPPKPLTVRGFGRIIPSVMNLRIPTRCLGLTALASGSSRSLFNSVDFPRSAEEDHPPPSPPVLERLPHLERQKRQIASSLTTLLGLKSGMGISFI